MKRLINGINVQDIKINAMESKERYSVVMTKEVSRKFNIGIEKVKETLRVTTQKGIRHAVHILHRKYRVYHMQLNRKSLNV